jgi:hypothetical protein
MATKSATQRKKSAAPKRHSISSGNPRSYGAMYKDDNTRSTAPSTTTPSITPSRRTVVVETPSQADETNWREEYDYVIRDLRSLGIVTTALFAVIIVAGFFI